MSTLTYARFPYPTLFRSQESTPRDAPGSGSDASVGPEVQRHFVPLPLARIKGASRTYSIRNGGNGIRPSIPPNERGDHGFSTENSLWRNQDAGRSRSEEHTSELQSLMRISYAVFCL